MRFSLDGGVHKLYIRYPNTDYFVEMYGGDFENGRGVMIRAICENVWAEKYNSSITIFSHDKNLICLIGRLDYSPEFNFMEKVASYNKGNPFNNPYPNVTSVNYNEIEDALSFKYLKLPDNRTIEYCYKTNDNKSKYFVVDYPKYNFKYNNQRFSVIENNIKKEYEIKNFVRYRDGDTTIITVIDENNIEHKFFSPTKLSNETLSVKWDDVELIPTSDIEKEKIEELLNSN